MIQLSIVEKNRKLDGPNVVKIDIFHSPCKTSENGLTFSAGSVLMSSIIYTILEKYLNKGREKVTKLPTFL